MIPYDYQTEAAADGIEILKETGMVYLAMEERTGKSLTSILIAEQTNVKRVLIITKKKALDGWNETLAAYTDKTKFYRVVNFHQAHKVSTKPDLVIIDEAHNYLSAYPKIGTTATARKAMVKNGKANVNIYDAVRRLTKGTPIIYLSATPHAQGAQMLYHQLKLSAWTPWFKYVNFYEWFKEYGKPYTIELNGIEVQQYDRMDTDKALNEVKHLFITKTRKELGFEHEPEDKIHKITLDKVTKEVYNELIEHDIVELNAGWLVADTNSKLRTSLHQLEGGTIKLEDEYFVLANNEKANYILEHFGDRPSLVIMYNYKAEKTKLERLFKSARILQATSYAEGVDLHKYEDLVIYSQDFSTARHTQRRARQCNKNRDRPINVHYLLVAGAISSQVYKTVSVNKKNFVDRVFNRSTL